MAHSLKDRGGERVEVFVMSVIEAVSPSGSSVGRSNHRRVSRHPVPPSPSPPLTTKSQSSQELVEDSLGSLATLLSVTSSSREFRQGADGVIKVITRSNHGKLHTRRKEYYPQRKNVLRRKKSSLNALSPQDLGRVSKSPSQPELLSTGPPSVVVTLPSSTSSSSPSPQDRGEKITGKPSKKNNHPSTIHLRKPLISNPINSIRGTNSANKSNDKIIQNSQPKIESASVGSTSIRDIVKKVAGQRSTNNTNLKGSPEQLRLHNNGTTNDSKNIVKVGTSQKAQNSIDDNKKQQKGEGKSGKETIGNQLAKNGDSDLKRDEKTNAAESQVGEARDDREDLGYQGRMCIHHHHHSHHHHYHYYDNEKSQKNSIRGHLHHNHHHHNPLDTNNHHDAEDEGLCELHQNQNYDGNINSVNAGVILQEQHLHGHHSTANMKLQNAKGSTSVPPSHEYSLDDISFYRKFSATSPLPSVANRYNRSKSSLARPAIVTELNTLSDGKEGLCSKEQRQKSRSTPVRLDAVGAHSQPEEAFVLPKSVLKLAHEPVFYQNGYGCKCGGCLVCCNELSCDCCCDECCCARQYTHVSAASLENLENGDAIAAESANENAIGDIYTAGWETGQNETLQQRNLAPMNRASRSMESIISLFSNDFLPFDDDEIDDPDSFIDAQFLRHLALFQSDDDVEDDEDDDDDDKAEQTSRHFQTNDIKHDKRADSGQEQQYAMTENEKLESGNNQSNSADCVDSSTTLVVVGNVRGDRSLPATAAVSTLTDASEPTPSRNTSIIMIKKTPTRSSVYKNGQTSDGDRTGSHRQQRSGGNSKVLRTANGEIRTSPALPVERQQSSYSPTGKPEEASKNGAVVIVEEQTRRSAVMTVTMDTMSLFLDAVHLQMNQS